MEPDVSIETGSMIRIAVIPVGGPIPHKRLREYVSMLARHTRIGLSSISSFYSEHQKSPFAHQSWESSSLRFKYMVGGAPPSPWEDFQAHRKILAVIGLCHCPASPDLDLVIEQFASVSKGYASALANRLFAFSPSDEQLKEGREKEKSIILFPSSDQQAQELHILTMIQDLAATLLMEFEKWVLNAESAGTILKTPLDSQSNLGSEEVIKAKKRRLARAQKTIGDYCLLAGSPVDANAHFLTAIELARLTGDVFWHSGALEGSVCALLVDRMDERDSLLEEEAKYRYYTVIQLYKRSYLQDYSQRVSTVTFELEAQLKLSRYLCRRLLVKEALELLMNASDGAKSLIDASDRLILYVEIARLFGTLGYQRKAAFFSRQVAQLYLKQDSISAAISAMQVLSLTSNAYHVQSRGTNRKKHASPHDLGSSTESGKMNSQSIISLFESQWSTLQMVVLREILLSSVRAGDPLVAWSAAARLLRSFYPLITPAGQSALASSLTNSANRLPSGTRCADPVLPFIRLHSFRLYPSQMDIIKRNPSKKDWWTGSAPSGPFIYTPFSKSGTADTNKQDLTWIVGEPVQVLVELANPCAFDLVVESIYLSIHSGNFDAFPVSVNLPPNTAKVILLSGIPTKVGPVAIPGCIVHCFGVITEHLFRDVDNLLLGASQGLVLSDPFRCCGSVKLKIVHVPSISVVPPLPLLVSYIVGGDGATILYEGEIHDIRICLTNAGTVPIEQAHISLQGKNQNSVVSIAHDTLNSALPLKPGAEVSLIVTIKAWKLNLTDSDHDPGKHISGSLRGVSKEGSSPLLAIHYAGPALHTDELHPSEPSVPPGRRLVVPLHISVVQGLHFVKARLLSMEIPARVSEILPKPVTHNENNAEGISIYGTADSLVKVDPYRGSWELRLLELELSNPADVVFDVNVSVQLDTSNNDNNISVVDHDTAEFGCPKTRIDPDSSARVLIPLEHFKLPILDSFQSKSSGLKEKNPKTELAASISNLVSRIKIKWQSGRNSSGELDIKDALQAALQSSVMDILLPDPLTFGFRLATTSDITANLDASNLQSNTSDGYPHSHCDGIKVVSRSCISTHEMTNVEVLIRNNTRELIRMNLTLTCRDVAGDNCIQGHNATVLWAGVLSGVSLEIPPLEEAAHPFSLYFLVPGEYSLLAAAVVDDPNDVLRACARIDSPEEPIFCRSSPFRINVTGIA